MTVVAKLGSSIVAEPSGEVRGQRFRSCLPAWAQSASGTAVGTTALSGSFVEGRREWRTSLGTRASANRGDWI